MSNLEIFINTICEAVAAETPQKKQDAVEKMKTLMAKDKVKVVDPEHIVRDMFLEMGVPDHLIGYDYAVDAIVMCVNDRNWTNNITFGLYPTLSDKYKTTPSRIERGIRHLIGELIERGDSKVIDRYFGNFWSAKTGRITNGEFIARSANIAKKKMREM